MAVGGKILYERDVQPKCDKENVCIARRWQIGDGCTGSSLEQQKMANHKASFPPSLLPQTLAFSDRNRSVRFPGTCSLDGSADLHLSPCLMSVFGNAVFSQSNSIPPEAATATPACSVAGVNGSVALGADVEVNLDLL